jgi:hypothetical protein
MGSEGWELISARRALSPPPGILPGMPLPIEEVKDWKDTRYEMLFKRPRNAKPSP